MLRLARIARAASSRVEARAVLCAEWEYFPAFRDYVDEHLGPRPAHHRLLRIDDALGFQPGNIMWSRGRKTPQRLGKVLKQRTRDMPRDAP